VGFGHARLDTGVSGTTVTKLAGGSVPAATLGGGTVIQNASVALLSQTPPGATQPVPPFTVLHATDITTVMTAHVMFTEPLTVPVLVRATRPAKKQAA
jgi:hypothetical protein